MEITRELISAFQLSEEDIEKFEFDEEIVRLAMKFRMKLRTMVNFFHLFVAIKEDAYLLSGDKDLIRIVRENKLYDESMSYTELRKLFT